MTDGGCRLKCVQRVPGSSPTKSGAGHADNRITVQRTGIHPPSPLAGEGRGEGFAPPVRRPEPVQHWPSSIRATAALHAPCSDACSAITTNRASTSSSARQILRFNPIRIERDLLAQSYCVAKTRSPNRVGSTLWNGNRSVHPHKRKIHPTFCTVSSVFDQGLICSTGLCPFQRASKSAMHARNAKHASCSVEQVMRGCLASPFSPPNVTAHWS